MKSGDTSSPHLRGLAQVTFFLCICVWQTFPALIGMVLFILLVHVLRIDWKYLVVLGVCTLPISIAALAWLHQLGDYFLSGWLINRYWWKLGAFSSIADAMRLSFGEGVFYVLTVPFPMVGIMAVIELIPGSAHERQMWALQHGKASGSSSYASQKSSWSLERALKDIYDAEHDGTVLGVSRSSGKPVVMPDANVNQLALVLGTTGGGKTVTLRRFYRRAILAGYPLIIVDGKPTAESTQWIANQAKAAGKPFYGFNCENYWHYDPLAHGGHTELKDKIISLKDEWESDYYRSIAEDYLQTTFEILQASGKPYKLKRVVECLDFGELALLVRSIKNPALEARAKLIGQYERKDITGLQAHLNLLIHSEMGEYFEKKEGHTFDLAEVIRNNAVVYFALPALRFPSFSKVLGKLIINDIKAVVDRETSNKRIFTVFDEFSVFAGDQVLNLVNMGRGKGVHAIFGTQGLSDLKRVDGEFAAQVLNCVNTIICHRLNDHESAESVAAWAGTRDMFDVTAQIGGEGTTGMGSVRRNKEFIIHPDSIKQDLQPGEAFYISKVGKFKSEKIKVKYS
jgi:hypothetical protein